MDNFSRCYDIFSRLDNPLALDTARVHYGVAKGHQFMGHFCHLVNGSSSSPEFMQALVAWKDARVSPWRSAGEEEKKDEEEVMEEEGDKEKERNQNVSTHSPDSGH